MKKLRQQLKRALSCLLVLCMVMPTALNGSVITASAAENETTRIAENVTSGDMNYFTYSPDWVAASGEHWVDIAIGASNPESTYYTIKFYGNGISVYGIKDPNHGEFMAQIDDGTPVEHGAYAATRGQVEVIYSVTGLTEGEHTLKIYGTGTNKNNTNSKASLQVSYATVTHQPYITTDFTLKNAGMTISNGETVPPEIQFVPSFMPVDDIVLTSSDPTIVSVSDGMLTGEKVGGPVTITVNSPSLNVTRTVQVTVVESNATMKATIVNNNSHYAQKDYTSVIAMDDVHTESLTAWKNDKALSEMVIASIDGPIRNVKVTASNFTSGSNTIEASNVTATFLKEVEAYTGSLGGGRGDGRVLPTTNIEKVPDILYTKNAVNMQRNTLQPVWISINIPKDAAAGTYTGTLTVSANNLPDIVCNYTVEVADLVLADADSFDFDIELWQYPYSISEYYKVEPFSDEHIAILKQHMSNYQAIGGHAITTSIVEEAWGGQTYSANETHYPSMVKWFKETDGSFSFDFTHFDKWVQLNKDLGMGDRIICYSMIPWSNRVTYTDRATNTVEYLSLPVTADNYEEVWTQFLVALTDHAEEKGWYDDIYIGIDERPNMDKAFNVIDKVKNSENKTFKVSAAMDHFGSGYENTTNRIDVLSVGSTAAKGALQAYRKCVVDRSASTKKDYKTTIYTCTGHFPSSFTLSLPGESYWTMMFSAAQGADGFLRWAFDAWTVDPLTSTTHVSFEAGDCFYLYPQDSVEEAKTTPSRSSVRLEKMAEGVRDVNKLYAMKAAYPSLKTDVDAMLTTVKTNYGSAAANGVAYANETTKVVLPADMVTIKATIDTISKKNVVLNSLKEQIEAAKAIEIGTYDHAAYSGLQDAIEESEEFLQNTVVTMDEIAAMGNKLADAVAFLDTANAQVLYYDFDTTTITDKWDGNNGTLAGGSLSEDSVRGKSISFASSTDGITIANPSILPASQDWTISMWVKRGADTAQPVAVMRNQADINTSLSALNLKMHSNNFTGIGNGKADGTNDGYTIKAKDGEGNNLEFPSNQWTHLAVVHKVDGGTTIYVNGIAGETNANVHTAAPLKLIGGGNFVGSLDELRVYSKALSNSNIATLARRDSLVVENTSVTLNAKQTSRIKATLKASGVQNPGLVYSSNNTNVATVSATGIITGVANGSAVITVTNEETGLSVEIAVTVSVNQFWPILPQYNMPTSRQIVVEDNSIDNYLGQPDMIMDDDGKTLYTVYPNGHGKGAAILKKSEDGGKTWSDRLPTPKNWEESQETPTIYKLNMTNGTTKFIQISGGPAWGNGFGYTNFTGWTSSISDDQGETWTPYKVWYPGTYTIVAMASLIQLKDSNGNFIDKWMGVYHNGGYVNQKTYLTFDEDGNEQWSQPEPYLSAYRSIEQSKEICEVGMFRSPDGNRIVGLARTQNKAAGFSTIFWSDDEGETWSQPKDLPADLMGERHKIVYDPISGRLVITFREIQLDYNKDGTNASGDWMAGDWIAWVGTYDNLIKGEPGDYRIRLGEDFTVSAYSGDTGYAGLVALPDGTIVTDTYGRWNEAQAAKSYIIAVRFKLGEIDNLLGLVDRSELVSAVTAGKAIVKGSYTDAAWANYQTILAYAESESLRSDIQQVEVDKVTDRLVAATTQLTSNQVPAVTCTCSFTNLSLKQRTIVIREGESSVTYNMPVSSILLGDCLVDGHKDAQPVYTFAEEEDTENIGSVSGNVLTVTKPGTIKVKVTATVNGKTQEKTTVFTVVPGKPIRTVSFAGGTGATGTNPAVISVEEDGTTLLPISSYAKTGYVFVGWRSAADGNLYQARDTYTMGNQNDTLTAEWETVASTLTKIPSSSLSAVAESQETSSENSPASNAVDGNTGTIWHSNYSNNANKPDIPNNIRNGITIDLGESRLIQKLEYVPRDSINGRILAYKLYYSTTESGDDFQPVLGGAGRWASDTSTKTALFGKVTARRLMLRVTGSTGNTDDTFISAAEFYVYKVDDTNVSFTINFNPMSGTFANQADATKTVVRNEKIGALPSVSRAGHTFAGWFTAADGGEEITADTIPSASTVYYAHWTVNAPEPGVTYTITLNPGEGTLGAADSTIVVNQNTAIGQLPTPTRSGYTFDGWYTAATNGALVNASTVPTGDTTYYAHWTQNTPVPVNYTVSFNATGGMVNPATATVASGAAVGELPTPIRNGYTFDGWYTAATGGNKVAATTTVTGDITYYAQWTEITIASYTVTFDGNQGSVSEATRTVVAGEAVGTLPTATRSGYTFTGWFTQATGGTQITTATIPEANVTYYAQWQVQQVTPAPGPTPVIPVVPVTPTVTTYTVTFDGNGGTASKASADINSGEAVGTLPTATRAGYDFVGWFTQAIGGTEVTADTKVTAAMTVYAQWTESTGGGGTLPEITSKKTAGKSAIITWNKVKKATQYQIFMKTGKGDYELVKTVTGSKTKFTIAGLKTGKNYKFRVTASTGKNAKKKVTYGKSVTITYKNVSGYEGYDIQMKVGKGDFESVKEVTKGGTVTYTVKNAKVGKKHTFRLRGYSTVNNNKVYTVL